MNNQQVLSELVLTQAKMMSTYIDQLALISLVYLDTTTTPFALRDIVPNPTSNQSKGPVSPYGNSTNQDTIKYYEKHRNMTLELKPLKIGYQTVTLVKDTADAFAKADADYFRDTGKHIQVNSSFRSWDEQEKIYNEFHPQGKAAARPGSSVHELGKAVDVNYNSEVGPYLRKYGFQNPIIDDRQHFSIGEFSANSPSRYSKAYLDKQAARAQQAQANIVLATNVPGND
jgi:hypothetical protein